MVVDITSRIATAEAKPEYVSTGGQQMAGGGGDRPYFGSIPDFSQKTDGYALQGVADDSPASRAGLKAGDVIIKVGESRVGGLEDFDSALRKFKAHDKAPVVVLRDGKEMTFTVELDPPR
jgi:S1-C subfamily serine protease